MKTWFLRSLLAAALLRGAALGAQPAPATDPASARDEGFTLAAALAAMRSEHPALAAARGDVDAAEGDAVDARLWSNPTLSAAWTPGVRNSSYDTAGFTSVALSQFVELSGAPAARGRAAQALARASRATLDDVARTLALDLESAMVHLAASQRRLAVSLQSRTQLAEVQRVVDERAAAGAVPPYDATRIRASVALAQADVDAARADLARARGDFAAAVGPGARRLHGEAAYALDAPYPLPNLAALEAALGSRPDLRAANQRAAAADASVSAARRSVFPGVGVQALAAYGASPGQIDVGVGLSVPLPLIDRGQGSIPAAAGRADAARALASGLQSLEVLRLRGAFDEAQGRREALATFRAVAPSTATEALAEARAGYLNGRFSILELADAYSAWRDTHQRDIDLVEAARQAEIHVARIAGLQR